jgi:subtilisin family serine protease
MKKKSPSQSAFLNIRVLIGLAVFLSGICLALAGLGTFSNAKNGRNQSKNSTPRAGANHSASLSHAQGGGRNVEYTPADSGGRFRYMIQFNEKGMLHRQTRGGQRLQMNSPQAQTLRAQVMTEQANHIQAMNRALGHGLNPSHYFLVAHSGIAARLTPEEAQTIRGVPGIKSVERERLYHTTTFRSPEFIGANQIWDGTAVPPGGSGTKGEGIIIAMLDTGIDVNHPSFANDPACGHGTTEPDKLLSALDCSSTDPTGLCNGPDPSDQVEHGTHTSSTAGGNTVGTDATPPPFLQISGVAPCASIRAYKVCPTNDCPDADIEAGQNSVLIQGDAKVLSFSISGGTDPWNESDESQDFLDVVDSGVLVSAAAGNTGANPDPVGQVNHRGPWNFTVAASTKDQVLFDGVISASGPGSPPPDTQNIGLTVGSASPDGTPLTDFPIRHFLGQTNEGCSAEPTQFPPNFFDGSVALIQRGGCPFTEKITNAFNAGAAFVVIRNNQPGTVSMDTTGQPNVPAYSCDQTPGDALAAFVDANPTDATVNFALHGSAATQGDVLADFSLRGPDPAPFQDIQKPDITGPGVLVYAAFPINLGAYGTISGTSMATPHNSGSAALVRAVHSDWTVQEVKSALMMTSFNGGTKEDGTTPWDADDVGTGRIDDSKAALAGLVMDETTQHFLDANPNTGGDPKTLNIPSLRNMECTPSCTWTRTVRNTVTSATSWTATGTAITPGFTVEVSPSSFSFTGGLGETQELTITATPNTNLTSAVAFGEVVLHQGTNGNRPSGIAIPDARITVAIEGSNGGGGTPTPTPTPGGSCPPVITQSTSQTIVSPNSVACNDNATGFVVENHYWRAFDMNTFTGGLEYNITSIEFGIEQATSGSGTQPITVNLYANHGSPFPAGDWASNLLGSSGSINVPDQSVTIFSVPISVTVPAGTLELVMEVMNPDGIAAMNNFFIGSNTSAQTGTSYLSSAPCGLNDPTPTDGIVPGLIMHIVYNVDGSCPGVTPTPTPTPPVSPTPTGTPGVSPTPTPTGTPGRPTPTPRPRPTPHPRP